MENQTIKELTSFIKNSPTAFHAVKSIRDILTKEAFENAVTVDMAMAGFRS